MQDMEQRIKQETKDSLLETQRQVQQVLTQVRKEERGLNQLDVRFEELEMRMNGHLLSSIQKTEADVSQLMEKSNLREVNHL